MAGLPCARSSLDRSLLVHDHKMIGLPNPIAVPKVLGLIGIRLNPIALNCDRVPSSRHFAFKVRDVLHASRRRSPHREQTRVAQNVTDQSLVASPSASMFKTG